MNSTHTKQGGGALLYNDERYWITKGNGIDLTPKRGVKGGPGEAIAYARENGIAIISFMRVSEWFKP